MPVYPTEDSPESPHRISEMWVRVITTLVIVPLAFALAFLGGWLYALALAVFALIGIVEFYIMEKRRDQQSNLLIGLLAAGAILLSHQLREPLLWQGALLVALPLTFGVEVLREGNVRRSAWRVVTTMGGILYVAFPFSFLIAIRGMEPYGLHWLFVIIGSTWLLDVLSYTFGRMFGRHKLAPRLSPNKTIEGALGGILFSATIPMLVLLQIDQLTASAALVILIAPFVGVTGDLFESWLKRYFGVKDSGVPGLNILPGHGGVLDRFDAALWIITLYYGYLVAAGKLLPLW